ncbi:MAG: Wax ester synthase-like Acyl-CoA acyltransferase domain [Actinomycetia bacterium]|nr:Wax ester synthase-like Acyl-CoA acyltransferase domain [Actinomycetes bacterium]
MRMSDTEAVMWAVEKDPALRSDFCNLTILEHAPSRSRVRAKVATALEVIPRLRQRVVSAPLRIVPPEWVDDPDFNLEYHVRSVALPPPGGPREMLDLVGALSEAPFDRSRPLWEFTIIEGLADGGAAMLQKMHHTITDGVGGLKLSLSLVDFEADPPPDDAPVLDVHQEQAARTSPLDVLRSALVDVTTRNVGAATHAIGLVGHVATHPQELPGRVVDATRMAASMRRQLLVADGARSDVLVGRSLQRHYELFALPLTDVRQTAKHLGGTVNDVFVTGLAGALRRYHLRYDSACDELRMAMPVSTRERGDSGANRFSPVRVLVPLGPDDSAKRFASIHDRLASVKSEAALNAVDMLAGIVSTLPTSVLVGVARNQVRTIDFTASNLRGSPVPLYMGGARMTANYPLGPRTGCALNATVLSYCDEMHVGVNIDPAAVEDIPAFMDDLGAAFDELLALR